MDEQQDTGNPAAPQGNPEAIAAVVAPAPEGREAFLAHTLQVWRQIWSPGFPFEEARARAFLEKSYVRAYSPQGMARQNTALLATGDRRPFLGSIQAPTLVIHGAADPLIPLAAGKETAELIPGAKLLVIDGMGHDLPTGVWPRIVTAMARLAGHASA